MFEDIKDECRPRDGMGGMDRRGKGEFCTLHIAFLLSVF